jgi:environmental stress-induced protein Ves
VAPEPWKNGAGVTRTLACGRDAGGALAWRVSVAEIEHSGPFSIFPDIERIAVVLENGPLRLSDSAVQGQVAAPRVLAPQYVPTAYPGELELFADLAGAPVRCLNVMTRRGSASADVRVLDADGDLAPGPATVLFATEGAAWTLAGPAIAGTLRLAPYDSVVLPAGCAIHAARGGTAGRLVAVRLRDVH